MIRKVCNNEIFFKITLLNVFVFSILGLSFAPKLHTMETEGTIMGIKIEGLRKLEDQKNKQYYYVFSVSRVNQKDPQKLLRTYKEVYELNQKLNTFFRLAKFYQLPRPKSNSREFTEKKLHEVKIFFEDLMQTANEILHCDLVRISVVLFKVYLVN